MFLSEAIAVLEKAVVLRRGMAMVDPSYLDDHPDDWPAVAQILLPRLRALRTVHNDMVADGRMHLEDADVDVAPDMVPYLVTITKFVNSVNAGEIRYPR